MEGADPPIAMTIVGSDSGGGAGMQADLKTFAALEVFGTCAITAVTAQNTATVAASFALDPEMVKLQIETVLADFGVSAVKTGMLANSGIVSVVADLARAGRWARGMIQILRIDNPLFAPGLTIPQRLCYFNAMCHFLYAVPRLIFLTAPLIYLLLNHTNIPGYWAAILVYALPHLTLSNVTNSRIQGEHRHSFWNEIYETVLSPYILLPTMMALINPKLGKFNVTSKGGVVKETFFDTRIAQPFLVMLLFNIAGLLGGDSALLYLGSGAAGHGADERDLVHLQHHHSGRVHGGSARAETGAHHGAHQCGFASGGAAGRRQLVRRRDGQFVLGRQQHPVQGAAGADPAIEGAPGVSIARIGH